MSSELIRYNRDQTGLTKVSEARRTMDLALAKLCGTSAAVTNNGRVNSFEVMSPQQAHRGAGSVIDVPRICAVHNRTYVTRYVQAADGFFHYGQGIRITSRSSDQYGPDMLETGTLQSSDLEDETCPWCGAWGFGAILCNACNRDICYGKTIANTFFHCRETCPGSGRLATGSRETRGLRPQLGSGTNTFSGG